MDKKLELDVVVESLLNEGTDSASQLIDQWFAAQIADLKTALDAKAASVAGPVDEPVVGDEIGFVAPVDGATVIPVDEPVAIAPEEPMVPVAADAEPTVEPAPVEEPVAPEAEEEPAEAEEVAEEPEIDLDAEDAVEKIAADLDQLKADFLAMLQDAEHPAADEAEAETSDEEEEKEEEEAEDESESEEDEDEEVEESEEPIVDDNGGTEWESDDDNPAFKAEAISEEDEDFAALEEAYALKTVTDKLANKEGAQVGEAGKVPVQKKSPVVSKKADARVGGTPVKVTGDEAKGFGLEKAPKVTDVKLKDGEPANAKEEGKKVSKEGDKAAVLNKSQGKENTKSPVGSVKKTV